MMLKALTGSTSRQNIIRKLKFADIFQEANALMSSEEQPNIIDNPKLIFDDEDNYIDGDWPNTGGYLMATRRTESVFHQRIQRKLYTPIKIYGCYPKSSQKRRQTLNRWRVFIRSIFSFLMPGHFYNRPLPALLLPSLT